MLLRYLTIALVATTLGASAGAAQDFGVMESAEIIQTGNFKFTGYPMFILGEDGADGDVGAVLRAGYGFSNMLDGELLLGLYDGATLFGGNLELALIRAGLRQGGINLAARGGVHLVSAEVADATGLDLALLLSTNLSPNLELVGALDFNQNFYDEPFQDVSTLHIVPGIEYRLGRTLDLLGEVGIGLNDNAANYVAVGLAFYLR